MKKFLPIVLSFMMALLSVNSLSAKSPCQGLEKSSCKSKSSCCWVKSHERKGKTVKGYCRKCGGKKSAVKKSKKVAKKEKAAKKIKKSKKLKKGEKAPEKVKKLKKTEKKKATVKKKIKKKAKKKKSKKKKSKKKKK